MKKLNIKMAKGGGTFKKLFEAAMVEYKDSMPMEVGKFADRISTSPNRFEKGPNGKIWHAFASRPFTVQKEEVIQWVGSDTVK